MPDPALNRLQAELRRLYLPNLAGTAHSSATGTAPATGSPHPAPEEAPLIDARGQVPAMVLALARPADWPALSAVWHGVQADLDLPAPAIAVAGADGYQLWFSLAEPVPAAQAAAFLDALRRRYLGDIKVSRVGLLPAAAGSPQQTVHARPVPAMLPDNGHWSAFVTADLAPVFDDEPWLDSPPNPGGQADLLSRLKSIPVADFEQALQRLLPAPQLADAKAAVDSPALDTPAIDSPAPAGAGSGLGSDEGASPTTGCPAPAAAARDPKRFLLDVMNDDSVPLSLRIAAATALLPYVDEPGRASPEKLS